MFMHYEISHLPRKSNKRDEDLTATLQELEGVSIRKAIIELQDRTGKEWVSLGLEVFMEGKGGLRGCFIFAERGGYRKISRQQA